MISFKHRGGFNSLDRFLKNVKKKDYKSIFEKYAKEGVNTLSSNTPKDSGQTANSWSYEIVENTKGIRLFWTNSNIQDGIPIVILLQYGHGTRSGEFVSGRDFINPAIKPIFDKIVENLWKEVTNL